MRQAASVSDLDDKPEHRLDQLIEADQLPEPESRGPDHVTWRRADLEAWRAKRPAAACRGHKDATNDP